MSGHVSDVRGVRESLQYCFFSAVDFVRIIKTYTINSFRVLIQIPESPIWLLSKGRNEKAMNAICWLRGWVDPCVVATEYQELMFYYKTSVDQSKSIGDSKGLFSSFLWIKSPSVYRPLRLATIYYIFTLISCLTPCRPYIVKLMYESGVKDTHSISLVSKFKWLTAVL